MISNWRGGHNRTYTRAPRYPPRTDRGETETAVTSSTLSNVSGHAGRLRFFLSNWTKLTSDPTILNWIQGYRIPFRGTIQQQHVPVQKSWSVAEKQDIIKALSHLLEIKAICKCAPCKGQFCRQFFLFPNLMAQNV